MRFVAPRHRYGEIADDLCRRIDDGAFPSGAAIPSLEALARQYGVARMTVRRAVSELCSEGRLRAVHGVGTFVTERSSLAGVVLVTRVNIQQAEPIRPISDVLAGASHACAEAEVPLITINEGHAPGAFFAARYGFVLDFTSGNDDELAEWTRAVRNAGAPYISIGYDHGLPNYLGRDTAGGTRTALGHLHELGHRRVVMLARSSRIGRRTVILPVTIEPPPGMELRVAALDYGSVDPDANYREIVETLDALFGESPRPTAILAGTGFVAHSALSYCAERGLRVPEDCSVMGYCRDFFASWNMRTVTRVDNPFESIARQAVRDTIRMASGDETARGRRLFDPAFVEGDTCGPCPDGEDPASGEASLVFKGGSIASICSTSTPGGV